MKKFKYIALGMALVFGMSSCNDYLDVNTDEDNPTSTSATVNTRLPWIQNYFAYAWGTAGMRSCTAAGLLDRRPEIPEKNPYADDHGLNQTGTPLTQQRHGKRSHTEQQQGNDHAGNAGPLHKGKHIGVSRQQIAHPDGGSAHHVGIENRRIGDKNHEQQGADQRQGPQGP